MASKTMYMARIDSGEFAKWKENNGEFNGRLMFQLWINHLSDEGNFYDFHKTIKEDERCRTQDDVVMHKIREIDRENWNSFMELCRVNGMFANDMINVLIKRFNSQGWCIETEIKV